MEILGLIDRWLDPASSWVRVGGDGAIPNHFGRPRHEFLQARREAGDVRRRRMLGERRLTREGFDEREVGRVVGVLQQFVLQAARLGTRWLDQSEQDAPDFGDGLGPRPVTGDDVDRK